MTGELRIDDAGPVAIVCFNRPASRNALTLAMVDGLREALGSMSQRQDLRAIVLRGEGELPFSAGYDVGQLPGGDVTVEHAQATYGPIRTLAQAMLDCPHPIIGAGRKFIFGAALDLFCHCDLRVCEDGTSFTMPVNKLGFNYPQAGLRRLALAMGWSKAMQMLLTASPVSAQEAQACGLVHKVFAPGRFDEELKALCDAVAANAPLSMRDTKAQMLAIAASHPLPAADEEFARLTRSMRTADVREAMAAFKEKRPPRFRGE